LRNYDKSIRDLNLFKRLTGSLRVLPDFLIIGSQKSGTSSLYSYLTQTPYITPSAFKEVHFFDTHFERGINWYRGCFPTIFSKKYQLMKNKKFQTCDATPYYLFHPLGANRASKYLPEIKIIILLRNPVDRAHSHYNMIVEQGREELSFEDAIKSEEKRLEKEEEKILTIKDYFSWNHMAYSYLTRGIYIKQIKEWMNFFPKEKFLIINSESFAQNPKSTVKQTLKFLGLPPHELPSYTKQNVGNYSKMNPFTRKNLEEFFRPYNEELYKLLDVNYGW